MDREKLAREIHDLLDIPTHKTFKKSGSYRAVQAIIKAITDALHRKDKVIIQDFGVFYLKRTKPRKRYVEFYHGVKKRGPTGHIITPAKTVVVFKPYKSFLALVNEEYQGE